MKVKFTLEEKEYNDIEQMFEDIPIDLCQYVDCPPCDGDSCVCCPLKTIRDEWEKGLGILVHNVNKKLIPLKPDTTIPQFSLPSTTIGGQMVRKMIEQYEKEMSK